MPSRRYFDAKRELIGAFDAFLDALHAELGGSVSTPDTTNSLRTGSTPSPQPAKGALPGPSRQHDGPTQPPAPQPTVAAPRRTPVVGGKPLPVPSTPAPKGEPQLTDAQRAEHLPEATRLAREVVKLLGPGNPQLRAGVKGQLALNRIPHDATLLDRAIAEASK